MFSLAELIATRSVLAVIAILDTQDALVLECGD